MAVLLAMDHSRNRMEVNDPPQTQGFTARKFGVSNSPKRWWVKTNSVGIVW